MTFVSADGHTAFAHRLASGVTTPLFTVSGDEDIYDVQLSPDGKEFFTSSWKHFPSAPLGSVVRRHTESGVTVLEGVVEVLVARGHAVTALRVSPASLYVLRRGEAPSLIGTGCTELLAWSPDDARILCATGLHTTYGIFDLDGGSTEPVPLPEGAALSALAFHWDTGGIKVSFLTECYCRLTLYDHATRSSRLLLAPYDGGAEREPRQIAWSSDGSRAAYWRHFCDSDNAVSCTTEDDYFYVLDVASGPPRRVAVHGCHYENAGLPDCNAAQVAISPTGFQIAYTINNRLFLLDVR